MTNQYRKIFTFDPFLRFFPCGLRWVMFIAEEFGHPYSWPGIVLNLAHKLQLINVRESHRDLTHWTVCSSANWFAVVFKLKLFILRGSLFLIV